MTDKELANLVLELKKKGYKASDQAWYTSISWVEYECGTNFCIIYTSDKAPSYITRTYDVHPNEG